MFNILYKHNLNKINILNFLICLIPLTLIIGNLAINLNIILICIIGVFEFGKKVFLIENKLYLFLILLFFTYLIGITIFNNWSFLLANPNNNLFLEHVLKSLFYLRFLMLFLIIYKLIDNNNFNTKYFFISCAFFSFFISIDLVIQFFFKQNILGLEITKNRPSSFFGEENIAGGYLQKFIIFLIFFILIKKKNKKNIDISLLFFFSIFFIPIIFTANKMPIVLYFASIILYFLIEKKFKEMLFGLALIIFIISIVMKLPINNRLNVDLKNFVIESKNIIQESPGIIFSDNYEPKEKWGTGYKQLFHTGIKIWQNNKIFGHGLKSFRLNCTYEKNQTCNTHPHNYFIEILDDTGLIGIFLLYSIFISGTLNYLKEYKINEKLNSKLTTLPFFLIIFFEFFPIRSSGSFFTTNNSIVIFLTLAVFLNFKKIKEL